MAYDFTINQHPDIQVACIGKERHPVLIVDNLLNRPEDMLKYATEGEEFSARKDDFYPGVKKTVPLEYADALSQTSSPLLAKVFDLQPTEALKVDLSDLAITTKAPEDLLPIQCIPHFDTLDGNQFAVVHYLFKPSSNNVSSGTSFYRHRQTNFESIDAKRAQTYTKTLEREATTDGLPEPEYANGDSRLFERIACIEARFNRAIFYRSNVLHSGDIPSIDGLNSDPLMGRLTVTTALVGAGLASLSALEAN